MIQTVSSRRPSLTGTLLAIVGLALLVWQVRLVGLDHIGDGFKAVGWRGFLAILGLSLFRFAARSMAWITLIGRPVPLSSATAATISGDALGNLSFLSLLVSDPAKAFSVTRHAPAAEAFAALTAENFFYSVSVASVILGGTITLLATFVVPDSLREALWFSLAVLAGGLAAAPLAGLEALPFGKGEVRRTRQGVVAEGAPRIALLAFGTLLYPALQAAQALDATVVNMRWAKPLDVDLLLEVAAEHDVLVTLEEGALMGGAGSAVLEALGAAPVLRPVLTLGLPDVFIEHGDPVKLLALHGLGAAGIEQSVRKRFLSAP